ncbi:hypothetical protein BUALT_Bualt06G0127700 [Buddleja alternifolia]|uniref:NAC domain-containing protein n=1 Tax=Buddleja alternifolia TaxID=168488 RepID=A0AAV6XEQ3_9LAMI|nr:hypothetical protein BUALT_Bualt06G0127700 [Buddleja alternifolia]
MMTVGRKRIGHEEEEAGLRLNQEIMNTFTHVPPGFRFHPTDEELVDYYLRRKITSTGIELDEEGWVVCRVFKKKISTVQKINEHDSPIWFNDDQVSYMPEMDSPKQHNSHSNLMHYNYPYNNNNDNNTSCKKEILMDLQCGIIPPDHHHHQFLQLPLLESPKMPSFESGLINVNNLQSLGLTQENTIHQTLDQNFHSVFRNEEQCNNNDQVTDWRVLDKFVASQLSHEEMSKENNEDCNLIAGNYSNKQDRMAQENASTCQIDLWK